MASGETSPGWRSRLPSSPRRRRDRRRSRWRGPEASGSVPGASLTDVTAGSFPIRPPCCNDRGVTRSHVAAHPGGLGHLLYPDGKGRLTQRAAILFGRRSGGLVRGAQAVAQLLVEALLLPGELLDVLRPLEVRACHPARVGQDVGDDRDAPV